MTAARVWQEFESDRERLIFESEQAMARLEVREVDSRIYADWTAKEYGGSG